MPLLVGTLSEGLRQLRRLRRRRGRRHRAARAACAHLHLHDGAAAARESAATRAALRLVAEDWRREKLRELTGEFRDAAQRLGVPLADSHTPIQPVVLGSAAAALAASAALREAGFWVTAIRPPTVPEGSARLRITLSAAHERADVEALVRALATACARAAA
ncbi:MAG: aminotransferase class I/II-fold pyridoxal phosphate-dependent enzyme [Steroidobacteraceae bacterium]